MWPFTKKRKDTRATGPFRMRVRVIGCLEADAIRVIVGPDIGMLNGGSEQTWPIDCVPADLRFPNSEFLLVREHLHAEDRLERVDDGSRSDVLSDLSKGDRDVTSVSDVEFFRQPPKV